MQGDTVYLRGSVRNLVSADRAMALAAAAGKVVNLLYVDVPPTDVQILLKVQFATVDRSVESDLGLNLISSGAGNIIPSGKRVRADARPTSSKISAQSVIARRFKQ